MSTAIFMAIIGFNAAESKHGGAGYETNTMVRTAEGARGAAMAEEPARSREGAEQTGVVETEERTEHDEDDPDGEEEEARLVELRRHRAQVKGELEDDRCAGTINETVRSNETVRFQVTLTTGSRKVVGTTRAEGNAERAARSSRRSRQRAPEAEPRPEV